MSWRSLLDEFNETGRVPDGLEVVERGGDVPHVRCECGRTCAADMLVELDGRWICDGCRGKVRRKRGLSRRDMTELLGGKRPEPPKPTRPYAGGRRALDVDRE